MQRSGRLVVGRLGLFAVMLVLVVGLALRLEGALYGAPAGWLHSADEHDSAVRAILIGRGDLLPIHASKPTFYPAVIGGTYGVWYAWLKVMEGEGAKDFERRFYQEPFVFCLLPRLVSLAASMGSLAILFGAFWRRSLAELVWVLMVPAFGWCSVYYGHVGKEDALGGMLALASFACSARALGSKEGGRWWLVFGFACSGLAVATKYNCFFAALYPLGVLAQRGVRPGFREALGYVGAGGAGFLIGVPFALLHPVEFVGRTFGSAIFTQIVGGWNILLYDDHRGLGFLWSMLVREYSLALLPVFGTVLVLVGLAWREWLWGLVPTGLYALVLMASRQLDYQYLVPLTPVVAWLGGEGLGLLRERTGRVMGAAWLIAGVLLTGVLFRQVLGPVLSYREDTRLVAMGWLEEQRRSGAIDGGKPVLMATGAAGFYYPPLEFGRATYVRLADGARELGGRGTYFERAAANARPDAAWEADFLEIRTGFRRREDGRREFASQTYSTDVADYRGRYCAVIVPEWTDRIVEKRAPELDGLNKLVDALREEGALVVVEPVAGERAGPRITILRAP